MCFSYCFPYLMFYCFRLLMCFMSFICYCPCMFFVLRTALLKKTVPSRQSHRKVTYICIHIYFNILLYYHLLYMYYMYYLWAGCILLSCNVRSACGSLALGAAVVSAGTTGEALWEEHRCQKRAGVHLTSSELPTDQNLFSGYAQNT